MLPEPDSQPPGVAIRRPEQYCSAECMECTGSSHHPDHQQQTQLHESLRGSTTRTTYAPGTLQYAHCGLCIRREFGGAASDVHWLTPTHTLRGLGQNSGMHNCCCGTSLVANAIGQDVQPISLVTQLIPVLPPLPLMACVQSKCWAT
jgi:hypothetical protein